MQHQISLLRSLILFLQSSSSSPSSSTALTPYQQAETLTRIKNDIIATVRKAVDIISRYASVALPSQARKIVRQTILGLPEQWNKAIKKRDETGRRNSNALQDAAERILSFALEGVDVLATTTRVFSETIERADAFVLHISLPWV